MSDVFLSYKREDEPQVRLLREALSAQGLDVWWDRELPGGELWRERIAKELAEAACVIAVWSERSVGPGGQFVQDEATRAAQRGVLVPVRLDESALPLGFGEIQALDLVGWRGSAGDARFQDVLAAVRAKVAHLSAPVPRWPSLRRQRRLFAGLTGSVPLVVLVGWIAVRDAQRTLCAVPGFHGLCHTLQLGCHPVKEIAEREDKRKLRQVIVRGLKPFGTAADARAAALSEGASDARSRLCAMYENNQGIALLGASSQPETWNCGPVEHGVSCGFEGWAVCAVRIRETIERESCP